MSKWNQNYGRTFFRSPPCHTGPTEVIQNLYCGNEDEALDMAEPPIKVDTLIPLNSLNAKIWDREFRGEILYCPIEDYGTLPSDVLDDLVLKILDRLNRGLKVGLFCFGGHGRTGYVASVVLGKLGYNDPIHYLRTHYCREAVESSRQIQHIAEVLGKPELVQKYKAAHGMIVRLDNILCDYDYRFDVDQCCLPDTLSETEDLNTCGECVNFNAGYCRVYEGFLFQEDTPACDDFTER